MIEGGCILVSRHTTSFIQEDSAGVKANFLIEVCPAEVALILAAFCPNSWTSSWKSGIWWFCWLVGCMTVRESLGYYGVQYFAYCKVPGNRDMTEGGSECSRWPVPPNDVINAVGNGSEACTP